MGSATINSGADTPRSETLADDLLNGAEEIAAFVGKDVRQVFYQLQRGYLPGTKVGRLWVGSKARLRSHFGGGS